MGAHSRAEVEQADSLLAVDTPVEEDMPEAVAPEAGVDTGTVPAEVAVNTAAGPWNPR